MEPLHPLALMLHVISGFIALFAGTLILVLRKGGQAHRRLGRVFFGSLVAVSVSAFIQSILRPNPFLFMVGLFTLYQGLGGYRAVKVRLHRTEAVDLLITLLGTGNLVAMVLSGQLVLQVFAGISAFLVVGDVRTYALTLRGRPVPKLLWLQRHIGHMMGGYIAMVTAFLVVNFSTSSLSLWVWFAPTIVGVPLIVGWSRRFRSKPPAAMPVRD